MVDHDKVPPAPRKTLLAPCRTNGAATVDDQTVQHPSHLHVELVCHPLFVVLREMLQMLINPPFRFEFRTACPHGIAMFVFHPSGCFIRDLPAFAQRSLTPGQGLSVSVPGLWFTPGWGMKNTAVKIMHLVLRYIDGIDRETNTRQSERPWQTRTVRYEILSGKGDYDRTGPTQRRMR